MITTASPAQDTSAQRKEIILATLDQIQEGEAKREKAVWDAFIEAEKRILETSQEQKITREGGFWEYLSKHGRPSLGHVIEYNDNAGHAEDKKSELINRIQPSFKFEFLNERMHLILDPRFEYTSYARNPKNNSFIVDFDSHLSLPHFLYHSLYLQNRYTNSYYAPGDFGTTEDEFPRYWDNYLSINFEKQFNRLGYGIGYRQKFRGFEAKYRSERERIQHTLNLTEFLRIAPKTRLLLEQEYQFTRYLHDPSPSRDSDSQEINFGISGILTAKLTGVAKIGFRYQDYATAEDFKQATLSGDLGYRVSERTGLSFGFQRTTQETTYTDEDYCVTNSFSIGGSNRFAFNPRLHLNFDFSFEYSEYPKKTRTPREDDIYSAELGVGYDFREWFITDLGYSYSARKSNTQFGYDSNVFTLTTKVLF